jgi:hypothetical protein
MKRAAVFAMVIVVIASAWTYLAAQSSPTTPQKAADETFAPPPTQGSQFNRQSDPAAAQSAAHDRSVAPPLTPLQQRYVDLATKKARLMTEEQLQQAVNEFDRDVNELNAWSKVEESARVLREVIEKHPQTRAAGTARSVIRIIEQGRSPNGPVPDQGFAPRPDPGSVREAPFGAEPRPGTDKSPTT